MTSLQSLYITLLWYMEQNTVKYYFGAFSIAEKSLQINVNVYFVEKMLHFCKKSTLFGNFFH